MKDFKLHTGYIGFQPLPINKVKDLTKMLLKKTAPIHVSEHFADIITSQGMLQNHMGVPHIKISNMFDVDFCATFLLMETRSWPNYIVNACITSELVDPGFS